MTFVDRNTDEEEFLLPHSLCLHNFKTRRSHQPVQTAKKQTHYHGLQFHDERQQVNRKPPNGKHLLLI